MLDRVNVGAQRVTTDAELGLDGENILGGQRLIQPKPIAHGRLTPTDQTTERRLRARRANGEGEGRFHGVLDCHDDLHNETTLGRQTAIRYYPQTGLRAPNEPSKGRAKVGRATQHSVEKNPRFVEEKGGRDLPDVGQRIQARLAELGMSQAELARQSQLAQSTVNGLVNGRASSSSHLHVIARILGVSTAWLAGDSALALAGDNAESLELYADQLDAELIPFVDIETLGGGGFSVLSHVPVSRAWLREIIAEVPNRQIVAGRHDGDAMAPTIGHNDFVIIDGDDRALRGHDKLWALSYAGSGMVRRVRRAPNGSFQILADNPNVQPIVANAGDFEVLGRVAAIAKRV